MRTDQKLFLLKCNLSIFLVILWILGGAVFGVLLWLRMYRWTREYLDLDVISFGHFSLLVYMAQADVSLIILFSLCGLIGGIRTVKCALVVYLIALLLAFGLTVAGSVYGFLFRFELRADVKNNDVLRNIVLRNYTSDSAGGEEMLHVDMIQSEFQCCGGDDAEDYAKSNWFFEDKAGRKGKAPASCCKEYILNDKNPDILCPFWTAEDSDERNADLHGQGCTAALLKFFDIAILVVAGVAIALGVFQLICLVVVIILIHVLNNLYVPQPDDIVYDMARNQEKSPYPSRGDYKEYYT
ncbi:tetraspanin-6-like [Babylonia areolata]|uniref:tetraspanin-6-like n=1 Tax=Babylonia areolata TaxID=304850 RepID=UPI003FCFCDBB